MALNTSGTSSGGTSGNTVKVTVTRSDGTTYETTATNGKTNATLNKGDVVSTADGRSWTYDGSKGVENTKSTSGSSSSNSTLKTNTSSNKSSGTSSNKSSSGTTSSQMQTAKLDTVTNASGNTATDYSVTEDSARNSELWRIAQNDTSLSDTERKSIQDALHAKNLVLNSDKTFDSHTGTYKTKSANNDYIPTMDADTNSELWRKAQNDTTLTQEQREQIQNALHQQNVNLLSDTKTFDPNTGLWTDKVATIVFDASKLIYNADGSVATGSFDTVEEYQAVVNALNASTDGTYDDGNGNIFVANGNKIYYTQDNGESFYQLVETEEEKPIEELNQEELLNELYDMLYQEGTTDAELEDFMTWAEAQAQAQARYNPIYDQALQQALSEIDTAALQSGFYGQLPTEALRQQAVASATAERTSAITDLAMSILGEDRETALAKLEAALEAKQVNMNSILELINVATQYNSDGSTGGTTGQTGTDWTYTGSVSEDGKTKGKETTTDKDETDSDKTKSYDNGGLTTSQIKELQKFYGVTADGYWGSNSSKAAGGLTAKQAYQAYINMSKMNYSPDEGVFTWNGKNYSNAAQLASEIEKSNLTSTQKNNLLTRIDKELSNSIEKTQSEVKDAKTFDSILQSILNSYSKYGYGVEDTN